MNTCAEVAESIGAWLDGELSDAAAEAVRSHLEICPGCSEERRQLEKLDMAMKSLLEAKASRLRPETFWPDLQRRVEARRPWYVQITERSVPAIRVPSLGWAVPAVIVLLIGALYFSSMIPAWNWRSSRNGFAAVESIDAYGRNVALLREYETKTTVIWIYQNPDSEDEASGESNDKGPAF